MHLATRISSEWRVGIQVKASRIFLRLLVATSSALLGLFLVELVLVSLAPQSELEARAEAARKLNMEFDARTRLEVVDALRRDGLDAWPTMKPYLMLREEQSSGSDETLFPLGGISESTSVYCNAHAHARILET